MKRNSGLEKIMFKKAIFRKNLHIECHSNNDRNFNYQISINIALGNAGKGLMLNSLNVCRRIRCSYSVIISCTLNSQFSCCSSHGRSTTSL